MSIMSRKHSDRDGSTLPDCGLVAEFSRQDELILRSELVIENERQAGPFRGTYKKARN